MADRDLVSEFTVLKENYDRVRDQSISAEASMKSKKEALDKFMVELKAKGINSIEELKAKILAIESEISVGIDGITNRLKEVV